MDPLFLRKIRIDRQGMGIKKDNPEHLQQNRQNTENAAPTQNEADIQQPAKQDATQNIRPEQQVKPQDEHKPTNLKNQSEQLMKEMRDEVLTPKQLKMNYLASMERSGYVKKIMNLPRTLPELLIQLQNPAMAKDIQNVMMQAIPQPDTQRADKNKSTDKTDSDGKNQQRGESDSDNKQVQKNINGFNEVLEKETARKQAILERYNIGNKQEQPPKQITNPSQNIQEDESIPNNILKGTVEVVEDGTEETQQNQQSNKNTLPEGKQNDIKQQVNPQPQAENKHPVNNRPQVNPQPQAENKQPVDNRPQVTPQPQAENKQPVDNRPQVTPQPQGENKQPVDNRPQVNPQPQAENKQPVDNRPQVTPQPQVENRQPVDNRPQVTPQPQVENKQPVDNRPQVNPQPQAENRQPVDNRPQVTPQPQVENKQPVDNRPQVTPQPQVENRQPVDNRPQVTPQPQVENRQPVDNRPQLNNHPRTDNHSNNKPINTHPHHINPKDFRPENFNNRIAYEMNRASLQPLMPNRMPILNNPPQDPRFMNNQLLNNDLKAHEHRHRPEMHEPPPPPKAENKESEAIANLYANLSMNDMQNPTLSQMQQRLSDDAVELLFRGLINLNELSETIKHNGQDARSKLILAMANASKQGIDNSQLTSTMKLVTESMAAKENDPSSILKNIIMLYLPWYPLQEGVGFNLSIETMPNSSDFSSLLKVYIQTRNYGNVNGSMVLLSGNNVDMNIQCNDVFPKDDLLDRMQDVTKNHSIQSNITVEEYLQQNNDVRNQQAKVNLSSTYELNPFLLLMAHSFIKNTIIIDSGANA